MVRAWTGIRIAAACTLFSALTLAAGPAQAGVDLVDGAAGGEGGGALGDPVEDVVRETVNDTVGRVTDSSDAVLRDIVRKVTEPARRSPQARPSHQEASSVASSSAPPRGQEAHGGQPARERARDGWNRRPPTAVRGARPVAAAPTPHVVHPCESGSLAARDLRGCARAGIPLPGLGGPPRILPVAGLAMVGSGLLLVARGRRRGTCFGPAD